MTKTITLQLFFEGQPKQGAHIIAGTLVDNWKTTDENGEITMSVADDFLACVPIAIRDSGAGRDVIIKKVLEAGGTYPIRVHMPANLGG
jgi:hypothetical protein